MNNILTHKEVLDLKEYYKQWNYLPGWAIDKIFLMALLAAESDDGT